MAQLKRLGRVECYSETDCQRYQGHHKPGTSFRLTMPNGKIARIFVIASVD